MDLSNALFFYHRLKVVTPQSSAKLHCPLPSSTTNAPMIGPYAVACNHMWAFMESIGYDIPGVTWLYAQYGHSYWIALLMDECSDIPLHQQFPCFCNISDAGMMWIWPERASSLQTPLHVHCLGDTYISIHSMHSPMTFKFVDNPWHQRTEWQLTPILYHHITLFHLL
jgi:hypothetical protein